MISQRVTINFDTIPRKVGKQNKKMSISLRIKHIFVNNTPGFIKTTDEQDRFGYIFSFKSVCVEKSEAGFRYA